MSIEAEINTEKGLAVTREFPAPKHYKGSLIATAKANLIPHNKNPFFSVTGECSTLNERIEGNPSICGCLHDLILEAWPEVKPVIDLHLCNAVTGEPMHALDNGWFWFQGALPFVCRESKYHGGNGSSPKSEKECAEILSKHLRVPEKEIFILLEEAVMSDKQSKIILNRFIARQRSRWKKEAKAGINLILKLREDNYKRTLL
jgi:hypothetical protein